MRDLDLISCDTEANTCRLRVKSLEGSAQFCKHLAPFLRAGMTIGLSGELGAGKTALVRLLVEALGGKARDVQSPSYVLQCVYPLELESIPGGSYSELEQIHHWDVYRLGPGAVIPELLEAGLEPRSLSLVEWPEYAAGLDNLLELKILLGFGAENCGEEAREISLCARTPGFVSSFASILYRAEKLD